MWGMIAAWRMAHDGVLAAKELFRKDKRHAKMQ